MLEKEEAGQPQRHCPNCGAEVRPEDAFCAACGKPLGAEDSDSTPHDSASQEPGLGEPKPVDDTQDEPASSVGNYPGWMLLGGKRWLGVLRDRARWFKELPMVSKVLVGGLAILLASPILILLSPLALVTMVVLFGVSLIGLIVRIGQRKSVKGWAIVAVSSLVLLFTFAGISGALYDEGALGGADREPPEGSTFEDYANASCLDEIRPNVAPNRYEVVSRKTYEGASEAKNASLVVAMNLRGNPWAVIDKLREETAGYDSVRITTYPSNLARYDRARDKVVPGPFAPPDVAMRWLIINSAAGEASLDVPKGDLNACGSSYETGGYRWGVPE